MISVIVPIYKVEQYLPKCLDSILAQTYPDLDIILVDDGSPDGCGQICEEYAKKDSRIRVFHTPNQGLSGARNIGIEKALEKKSKYIAFADSDDWLEPTMYEKLIERAEKYDCDVVVCGYFIENNGTQRIFSKPEKTMNHSEAVRELIMGNINNAVWNKLWKAECFSAIRFPQGQVFESTATAYLILDQIDKLMLIPDPLYHYLSGRKDSITHQYNASTLISKWKSCKRRYDDLSCDARFLNDQAFQKELEKPCMQAILLAWKHVNNISRDQRRQYAAEFREMNAFARKHFPLLGWKGHGLNCRIVSSLSRFPYGISLRITSFCGCLISFYRCIRSYISTKLRAKADNRP